MIELRVAASDADLEAWRRVRLAVLPNERTQTVEEIRAGHTPDRLLLVAELDGELAGSGMAGKSEVSGRAGVIPRVLPGFRRRGVGTELLRALAAHVESLGYDSAGSGVDDPGSLAFAERFGFREVDRQVEQVRAVGDEPPPAPPDGIEIVSVADRPDAWPATYAVVGMQAFSDMAVERPLDVSPETWEREWISDPRAMFVAYAGDEVVGCAGLLLDEENPHRAENALTAVRRDWRRRGVAEALKLTALAWAGANGISEVYTWTQRGNDGMRRLNERLGYAYRAVSISLRAPLPLP